VTTKLDTIRNELTQQGDQIKEALLQRQSLVEAQCKDAVEKASSTVQITKELEMRFDTDYKHFCQERMRWKSDFDRASQKALSNVQ
jgi:hypothetical protein